MVEKSLSDVLGGVGVDETQKLMVDRELEVRVEKVCMKEQWLSVNCCSI